MNLNKHIIRVKYLPCTNTKGSRVKLISDRLSSSVTIPYDYEFNSALDIALHWLENHDFTILCYGELRSENIIAVEEFKELTK